MIPTNAISPHTATAAAVPTVAATTSASRVRRTSTPRLAASRSPRLRTSTTRRIATITAVATRTYGVRAATSLQPVLGRLPRIQDVTSCRVSAFCCWTNVCSAVKKLATVTPARTSVAASRSRPAARPIA